MKPHYRKLISIALITAFFGSSLYMPKAQAGEMVMPLMPKPGTMVNLSPGFIPAHLKGITIHPDNALRFDFLIHKGEGDLDNDQKGEEYNKLVKYFLASLTIPDENQWVNLSPYEKGRIIQNNFGQTEMGRDLLSQDYLLKQITSSLMYPESGLGKVFWDKVYKRAAEEFGTTNVPVNTFNKVWIVPDEALVYESGNTAYILKSHLKVMLESDYLAMAKNGSQPGDSSDRQNCPQAGCQANEASNVKAIIKEIILPELEKEVNEGKNFAMLRQIYSGMILATWYKKALKESLLGKVYADKAKVKGVDVIPAKAGIQNIDGIYQQYLAAFKKGVYNYIKEDLDPATNQMVPRKYFSGGFVRNDNAMTVLTPNTISNAQAAALLAVAQEAFGDNARIDSVAVDLRQMDAGLKAAQDDLAAVEFLIQAFQASEAVPYGDHSILRLGRTVVPPTVEREKGMEKIIRDAIVPRFQLNVLTRNGKIAALEKKGRNEGLVTLAELKSDILGLLEDRERQARYNVLFKSSSGWEGTQGPGLAYQVARWLAIQGNASFEKRDAAMTAAEWVYEKLIKPVDPDGSRFSRLFDAIPALVVLALFLPPVSGFVSDLGSGVAKSMAQEAGVVLPAWDKNIKVEGGIGSYKFTGWMGDLLSSRSMEARLLLKFVLSHLTEGDLKQAQRQLDAMAAKNPNLGKYRDYVQALIDSLLTTAALKIDGRGTEYEVTVPAPVPLPLKRPDGAMLGTQKTTDLGGIDMNAANLDLRIKRDGQGVPLPLPQQDMEQLNRIQGFVPVIIEIKPVMSLPILSELQPKVQTAS